jgi:RNA polymerase sigma factor (sigma-70 family)
MNPRLVPTSRLARLTILRSQSDERLSYLAGHGSDPAFEAIVHRYRSPLIGHCVRILGSNADAEEAVQDALVSAHAALMNGHQVRSLGPWLHAVAHNAALRILRRRVARAEYPQAECNGRASAEALDAGRSELRDLVQAVQALPPRQRDAIVMRELEGRSYAEIAVRLGASDGAVRQLLNRARSSVRNTLGALVPAEPLLRWLVSADDSSPAKGVLTLSGGSAIAIKLSGAAALSAVTVVALLPPPHHSAPPPIARPGSVGSQATVTGGRAWRPAALASSTVGTVHPAIGVATRRQHPISNLPRTASVATPVTIQYSVPSATTRGTGRRNRSDGGRQESPGEPGGGGSRAPAAGQPRAAPAADGGAPSAAGPPAGSTDTFERPRLPQPQPQTSQSQPAPAAGAPSTGSPSA